MGDSTLNSLMRQTERASEVMLLVHIFITNTNWQSAMSSWCSFTTKWHRQECYRALLRAVVGPRLAAGELLLLLDTVARLGRPSALCDSVHRVSHSYHTWMVTRMCRLSHAVATDCMYALIRGAPQSTAAQLMIPPQECQYRQLSTAS